MRSRWNGRALTTGRLAPDFKTIADLRRANGDGIRNVCRRFVILYRELKLFTDAVVAIDGSNFKAVNSRERSFTQALPGPVGVDQMPMRTAIHTPIATIMRFSVSDTKPSGTLLLPPTQAHFSSRLST